MKKAHYPKENNIKFNIYLQKNANISKKKGIP